MKFVKITILFLLLIAGLAGSAFAQRPTQLSERPEEFVISVKELMIGSKNAGAIAIADTFETNYNAFNPENQLKTRQLCYAMAKKKYRARPHFELLFLQMNAAVKSGMNSNEIGKLIYTTQKVVEGVKPPTLMSFLKNSRIIIETRIIYQGGYNSLKAEGGTISFDYTATAKELETNPDTTSPPPTIIPSSFEEPVADDTSVAVLDHTSEQTHFTVAEVIQPSIEGAFATFTDVDLVIMTKHDTLKVQKTSGSYMFYNGKFVGDGGKIDWSIAGKPEVYVDLNKYNFAARSPEIFAQNAKLNYADKLDKPEKGDFLFRSKKHNGIQNIQYPQFVSYSNNVKIKNLSPSLDYAGGFSLTGTRITSRSQSHGNADLRIKHNGKVVAHIKSPNISITDSLVSAPTASVEFFAGKDTMSHPGCEFSFNDKTKIIQLYQKKGKLKNTPIFSSNYKMEIHCGAARWYLDSSKIDLYVLNAKQYVPVLFESVDLFEDRRYEGLKGIYNFHPLVMVWEFTTKYGHKDFFVDDMAATYKVPSSPLKSAMGMMAEKGLVDYDAATGKVIPKAKLAHYQRSRKGKKDYDNMRVESIDPPGVNATVFIDSTYIKVYGVRKVPLSDSLNVTVTPRDSIVKILPNRDLLFNGKIAVGKVVATNDSTSKDAKTKRKKKGEKPAEGKFVFEGENFKFSYGEFLVSMAKIDSIAMPETSDKLEQGPKKLLQGTVYINKKDNKSGKKDLPEYPKLDVDMESFKYFDKPEILNQAYDRKVYHKIDPIKQDSLNSNSPSSKTFPGEFNSDAIFPEFRETLRIQPDKSLGFVHPTPDAGYQIYKGDGKFIGNISLNYKGIRGKGKITYLTTTIESDDFIFYQDSVIAKGPKVIMENKTYKKVSYPDFVVNNYEMKWYVKHDSLCLKNAPRKPFEFYNKTATIEGQIVISTKGTFGNGLLKTRGAQVSSENYSFQGDKFSGREAFFEVKSDNPLKPAVKSNNVKFNFDLKKGLADFNPEIEGYPSNEFPYARYRTSIGNAVWDLNRKTVTMSMPKDGNIESSIFYSLHPDQDSLRFMGTSAVYDIAKYSLSVKGIPYIKIADTHVIPDSGRVKILENANMRPLTKSTVEVSYINKFHRLTDGNIKIKSAHEFTGDAQHEFITANGDTMPIRIDNFTFPVNEGRDQREEPFTTRGDGSVEESENVFIAPKVLYKGNVTMYADKENLEFDGYVRLDLKHIKDLQWLRYINKTDNREFALNLKDAKDDNGEPLPVASGLYYDVQANKLYTTFIGSKKFPGDKEVFGATGILNIDYKKSLFKLGNPEKIAGREYEGNVLGYSDSLNKMTFEGKINFINPEDRDFQIIAAGIGDGIIDSSEYAFNALLDFEFDIPSKATELMANTIAEQALNMSLPEAAEDKTALLYKIGDIAGNKSAEEYNALSLQAYTPLQKVASSLKGITISEVQVQWSETESAWFSLGKLGLSHIGKKDINAKIEGAVEIKKSISGDVVTIFLEPSPDYWYFFQYSVNPNSKVKQLLAFSSTDDFNTVISSKGKLDRAGADQYAFGLADPVEKATFIRDFYKNHHGINPEHNVKLQRKRVPKENDANDNFDDTEKKPDEKPAKDKKTPEDITEEKEPTDIKKQEPVEKVEEKEEEADHNDAEFGEEPVKKKKIKPRKVPVTKPVVDSTANKENTKLPAEGGDKKKTDKPDDKKQDKDKKEPKKEPEIKKEEEEGF